MYLIRAVLVKFQNMKNILLNLTYESSRAEGGYYAHAANRGASGSLLPAACGLVQQWSLGVTFHYAALKPVNICIILYSPLDE